MYYVADFETSRQDYETWVWLWCLRSENDIRHGATIETFFEYLFSLPFPKGTKLYFHNLSYDGNYIISYLLNHGYIHVEGRKLPTQKHFNTFIDDMGIWYTIRFKNRKRQTITICDSLKLLPFTADVVAKSFSLKNKGSLEYDLYRPKNYKATKEEIEYCENDCNIIYDALNVFFKKAGDRLTIGSNCLKMYKGLTGKENFKIFFPNLSIPFERWDVNRDVYKSVDNFCRQAYKGAFCWVNPKKKDIIINKGIVYDVNSLYPYVMYAFDYPYGIPYYGSGKPPKDGKIYFLHVSIMFDLKKDGVPCIIEKQRRFQNTNSWVTSSEMQHVEYVFTEVDLELILQNYIVDIEYIDWVGFKRGKNMFKDYIEIWIAEKIKAGKEGNNGFRTISKLFLNNLYGKFGQNSEAIVKTPRLENGVVKFDRVKQEGVENNSLFVPVAAYCTAYARKVLITAIMKNFNRFCYCDTDSIHLEGSEPAEGITIDDFELGAWKKEGEFLRGKFVRQKTYIEEYPTQSHFIKHTVSVTEFHRSDCDMIALCNYEYKTTVYNVTCAGFKKTIYSLKNKKVYDRNTYYTDVLGLGFDDFKEGLSIPDGKTTKKQAVGGVIIENTSFTMQ